MFERILDKVSLSGGRVLNIGQGAGLPEKFISQVEAAESFAVLNQIIKSAGFLHSLGRLDDDQYKGVLLAAAARTDEIERGFGIASFGFIDRFMSRRR